MTLPSKPETPAITEEKTNGLAALVVRFVKQMQEDEQLAKTHSAVPSRHGPN